MLLVSLSGNVLLRSSNNFSLPHNVSTFFVNLYLLSWEALLLHLSFLHIICGTIMFAIILDNFFYMEYKGKGFYEINFFFFFKFVERSGRIKKAGNYLMNVVILTHSIGVGW